MALSPWFSFLFIFTHDPFSSSAPVLMLMTFGILLLLLLLLSVIIVNYLITVTRKNRGHVLPPGFLCLPLVGETLKLVAAYRTEDPENFIDERVSHHGRLFTTHVFGERTVFSADPEFNRQVLTGEGRSFECSYPSSISTLLGRHSLLLMKGPLHKRMHSLILCRFSSPSALREFLLPDVDRLVRRTLDSWIPEGTSNSTSTTIRLLEQAKKITFEITVKQLLSFDPGVWTESLRREYLLLIEGFFSVPLALPCFLSSTTTYGRALQARNKVAEALRAVLRKRRQEKQDMDESGQSQQRQSVKKKQDMVEELMELAEGGAGLSEDEMVDFILALLVAGYETTSTIMTLAVKFLTENPPALALLLEEHDSIKAKKKPQESDALEWADYKSMPFTQYVINETLRVANVISAVFRRATTDVHFKGYTIPKGCMVFTSFRAVHLDLNYYEDARTFNPWRWQGKDAPQQTSTGGGIFTPFGGGPRLCPGYELARVEISVFLHHLVTRFRWEVAEKDKLVFFPTTRTLKGFPINVQTRRDNV